MRELPYLEFREQCSLAINNAFCSTLNSSKHGRPLLCTSTIIYHIYRGKHITDRSRSQPKCHVCKGAIEIGEGTEIIIIIYTQTKITWEQEGDEKNNMRASDAEAGEGSGSDVRNSKVRHNLPCAQLWPADGMHAVCVQKKPCCEIPEGRNFKWDRTTLKFGS